MKFRKYLIILLSMLFVAWLCLIASDADARSSRSGGRSSSHSSSSHSSSTGSRSTSSYISSSNRFSTSSSNSYKSPTVSTKSSYAVTPTVTTTYKPSVTAFKTPKVDTYVPKPVFPKQPVGTKIVKNKPYVPSVKTVYVTPQPRTVYVNNDRHDNMNGALTGALVATALIATSNANANQQSVPTPVQNWPKFNFVRDCNEWKCN